MRDSLSVTSRPELGSAELREILDRQPELIVRYDVTTGRIRFSNKTYATAFRSTPSALEGTDIMDLFAPHERDEVRAWWSGFTPDEPVRAHDTLVETVLGEPRWHRWTDTAIFDDEGRLLEIQAVGRDLTDANQLSDEVHRSEARFRLAFDHAPIGMALVDSTNHIRRTNDAFRKLLGCQAERIIGRDAGDFISDLSKLTTTDTPIETVLRSPSGFKRWCWVSVAHSAEGDRLLQIVDVHDRKTAQDRLAELVGSDPVTGLINRRGLRARLSRAVTKAHEERQLVGVAFLDLDGFKLINDSLGHGVGDDLLRSVADRIRDTVRPEDTAARFGGDEFIVVLTGLRTRQDAVDAANRLRQALASPHRVRGGELTVGASIGLAVAENPRQSPKDLLRAADAAMYQAKAAGTGEIVLSDHRMAATLDAQIDLRGDLEAAAHDDTMRLHYQPLVDAAGDIVAAEALLRWERPGVGPVAPNVFLPMLERSGLMASVGQQQLRRGCREIVELSTRVGRPLDLWFNVGLREVVAPNFAANVRAALDAADMSAERLCLELTEWSDLRDRSHALTVLAELRELGVRIALDDFGTGYASMDLLRDGPLACLKIDRGFTAALADDGPCRERALVAAMIEMARALDMQVVAEGVETESQLRRCLEMGVGLLQGWHLGRPVAPADWQV
ncbi:putative bifunctional diguanylate cyclase/phosphodiesterase [Euzebya tangerina]